MENATRLPLHLILNPDCEIQHLLPIVKPLAMKSNSSKNVAKPI